MGLHQVFLSQQEDPDLPQTQRGVAGLHLTHPLAERSHGGGWPSKVSGEFGVNYHGEQLDEGSLCQPHVR